MLKRLDFNGNTHVGVYCRANDDIAFVDSLLTSDMKKAVASTLDVEVIGLAVGGSTLIGSLLALNSRGMVVADFIDDKEIDIIRNCFEGEILIIQDKFNAAGNNILANDFGAVVHPLMKDKTVIDIGETMGVDVIRGTIAEINTVGMAAVATNKGLLCHPKVMDHERKMLEETMKVEVRNGTVNHGMSYVGAGLVANSHGAIAGISTTGIELNRIEDALNLIGD